MRARRATGSGSYKLTAWHPRIPHQAAHENDVMGHQFAERCSYEVFDTARSGRRVRTLADAGGEWARITHDCHVVQLSPTVDGGVVALVQRSTDAEVVKFDAVPDAISGEPYETATQHRRDETALTRLLLTRQIARAHRHTARLRNKAPSVSTGTRTRGSAL